MLFPNDFSDFDMTKISAVDQVKLELAFLGDPLECFAIGKKLILGKNGFPTNLKLGISLVEESSKSNVNGSFSFLAKFYQQNHQSISSDKVEVVSRSGEKEIYYLKRSIKQEYSVESMITLFNLLSTSKYSTRLVKKAAILSNKASGIYGYNLMRGYGFPAKKQDYFKGNKFLEKGVKRGYLDAFFYLSTCIIYKTGKVDNRKLDFLFLKNSSDKGSVDENARACFHLNGDRIQKERAIANLYMTMTKSNYPKTIFGVIVKCGNILPKNMELSFKIFKKIAKREGENCALNNLSQSYCYGCGIDKNIEKALKIFKQKAKIRNVFCTQQLLVFHEKMESKKKLKYYRRLIKIGDQITYLWNYSELILNEKCKCIDNNEKKTNYSFVKAVEKLTKIKKLETNHQNISHKDLYEAVLKYREPCLISQLGFSLFKGELGFLKDAEGSLKWLKMAFMKGYFDDPEYQIAVLLDTEMYDDAEIFVEKLYKNFKAPSCGMHCFLLNIIRPYNFKKIQKKYELDYIEDFDKNSTGYADYLVKGKVNNQNIVSACIISNVHLNIFQQTFGVMN